MTSAPSPASSSPAYSARSSAISMTLRPCSMPGPALPIISPGPLDSPLGAIPACIDKNFSSQMLPGAPPKGQRILPPEGRESPPAGAEAVKPRRSPMLVRRGEHTDLEARAKADPADDVLTRDYYT